MVMAEAMEITPGLTTALSNGASVAELRSIAVSEGMSTLAADGIRRAGKGETSLAEVIKTVSSVYAAELCEADGAATGPPSQS